MKQQHIHRQLSLPTGTETLHLREVARQRRITRSLALLFEAWGYRPAETPVVDYFEVYRRLLNEQDVRQIYRAVDRQGEILALRSDTTIFLAKQLGLHLSAEELPVRVYYDEQIVRAEEEHDISNNEFTQAGVELVGVDGVAGDAEVIILALEALAALGVTDPVIHIGSHTLLDAIIDELTKPAERGPGDPGSILRAVRQRRFATPELTGLPATLQDLLRWIGSPDELSSFTGYSPAVTAAIGELRETVATVLAERPDTPPDAIRVDMSELGAHAYYTGLAFAAYLPEGNTAVLRGGRYDSLLAAFGIDAPSVGFSMFPGKLPAATLAEQPGARDEGSPLSSVADRLRLGRHAIAPSHGGRT
ncbi:MAG: ATP phosphoribosyltransferase regulatory subunit [Spirochaeta sp.]|nr:ATP phosphoribosyltransferase regulatory subunit [Spirochaeta sp.]